MSTLTIRLPDDTADRLKQMAKARGQSMNKLVEEFSVHALAAWDTSNHFRVTSATADVDKALGILDLVDRLGALDPRKR